MSKRNPKSDGTISLGDGSARTWLTAGNLKQILAGLPEDTIVSLELHIDCKDTPQKSLSAMAMDTSVQFDHLLGFSWLTVSASIPEYELKAAGFQTANTPREGSDKDDWH